MTLRKASYLQGTVDDPYRLPAEDHRLNHAGLWLPSTAVGPLGVRSGVVWGPGDPGAVTVVAGGLSVAPFHAVIQGTVNGVQGPYTVTSDAAEFRAVVPESASTFRRGRLVARMRDRISGVNDTADEWTIEVVYGDSTATAGAAQLPPEPANSVTLRRFLVASNGTITLEGTGTPRTGPRGGILPVEAADTMPGAYVGQYRDHPTRGLERWTGAGWQVQRETSGAWQDLTLAAGSAYQPTAWPTARARSEPGSIARIELAVAGPVTAGTVLVTLPEELRPATNRALLAWTSVTASSFVQVNGKHAPATAGRVSISAAIGAWAIIQATYSLD